MLVRGFDKETPELATLRIEHAELKRDTEERRQCFQAMILVRFGKVLGRALQRLEGTPIVLSRRINRPHDGLITSDEFLDVHLRDEVDGGDCVVSGRV